MLPISGHPSLPWKILLAPLTLTYAAGARLHRAAWSLGLFNPAARATPPSVPLIVIGSLRAGGGGKTAVTLELARYLAAQGKRVGILAYAIRSPPDAKSDATEIAPASDWRESSDEAVMLARALGNDARVFVTRDRAKAWRLLARLTAEGAEPFDVLLSDDGLMDTRLRGTFRVALVRPGERPGLLDLLPAGPFRLTATSLKNMDFVLDFSREILLPEGFDFTKTWWLVCGLGNPADFRNSLERAGVKVAGVSAGPDHGLPDLEKARQAARRAGASGLLYTAKDAVKMEGSLHGGARIDERVALSRAFLSALDVFLKPASS